MCYGNVNKITKLILCFILKVQSGIIYTSAYNVCKIEQSQFVYLIDSALNLNYQYIKETLWQIITIIMKRVSLI